MRRVDNAAIKTHALRRFRSEYDYALFEYFRSAKVIQFLEQHDARLEGRILDAGCGGGGMPLSFAEEGAAVAAIDLADRFREAGVRLGRERGIRRLSFARADGMALPFPAAAFDAVLSHAVIEHVADAELYLRECARVLKPGGWMYLSTAPYLSFAGAHLPRLRVPIPLHLLLGRRVAFATFTWLARHATWTLREKENENTFIKDALANRRKHDDLLEKVRVGRLRRQIAAAGLRIRHEELTLTATFNRLPEPLPSWLRSHALTQDIVISVMQHLLSRVIGDARGTAIPSFPLSPRHSRERGNPEPGPPLSRG
ncbi:MAG: class I SAM-dependent methyltransferase [Acidobacteriota bacterium]